LHQNSAFSLPFYVSFYWGLGVMHIEELRENAAMLKSTQTLTYGLINYYPQIENLILYWKILLK
jgi:hypothetical protein